MLDYFQTIMLGIVQGLTEFLPVSSTGHLNLTERMTSSGDEKDAQVKLAVIVLLHVGTLLAVLLVYWRRMIRLIGADKSLIVKLIVGTIPAGLVGVPIKKFFPGLETNLLLTGAMFLVTALVLLRSRKHLDGETPYERVTYRQALLIGCAQAAAVVPGLSRSGSTIVAGLAVGLRRDAAATFSFLLSIPAIGGACLLEGIELARAPQGTLSMGPVLIGVAASFVVGLAALLWLIRWLERGRLHHFAYYLAPLGCAVVIWQLAAWWFANRD